MYLGGVEHCAFVFWRAFLCSINRLTAWRQTSDTDSKNTSYYVSVTAYNLSQPTPGYADALSRQVDIANNKIIVKYLFKKMSHIDDR